MILPAQTGVLQGGWEYITAAYAVTWLFLAGYTLSLWLRRPSGDESDNGGRP